MIAPAMRISVIIPSYNYARYLPVAVKSALAQKSDGIDVEGIIQTHTIRRQEFRASGGLQRQDNAGSSTARNTGIRAATGDFLLFLCADDFLTSGNLPSHLRNFASHPGIVIMPINPCPNRALSYVRNGRV